MAGADTAPDPGTPETVSADALPTWQINGVAWSQTVVGNTVYVVGSFSKARPPGTAAGDPAEVARSNILAYDITTGNLITSFDHSLNAQGLQVVGAPDGSRIYVGGDFTTVDGQVRNHVAAFDTASGALLSTFRPSVSSRVRALAVTGTTVYVGGNFFNANGSARTRLAAFDAATGALKPWAPTADDNEVWTMAVAPSGTRVIIGGRFTTLNHETWVGIGAVDATTGVTAPWSSRPIPTPSGGNYSYPYDFFIDNGVLYAAADGEGGHWFDGRFAANPENGDLIWLDNCYGASYGVFATGGVLYSVSHAHDCTSLGAFPDTSPTIWHRALATTTYPTGLDQAPPGSNSNYTGQPVPTLLHWFPSLAAGTYTGQGQAAWTVRGNSRYVVLGGEFPRVNGVAQQGLTRFAIKSAAPDRVGPVSSSSLTPTALSLQPGTARVAWQTTWDYDNETLRYDVLRDGGTTPVYTVTQKSNFWTLPRIGFVDTGLSPGSTHTYRVRVVDPWNNTVTSATSSPVTVTSTAPSGYVSDVIGDGAVKYWRLGEASGSTAYDWAGFDDATYGAGVAHGASGALPDDRASTFDGSGTGFAVSGSRIGGPATFSVEAWVNTTSTSGGKIVGFGDSPSNTSSNYDRHVYMDNAGKIWFGVYPGGVRTVTSPSSYNDGQWHDVVATLSGTGMALYVDGKRVGQDGNAGAQGYSGYWRIGGDNLNGWPNQPASAFLAGSIDDVAVYPAALSMTQVQKHYTDSGRTLALPPAPSDPYGKAVFDSGPDLYWRLGEASGTVAADASGNDRAGSYGSGVALGLPGALSGTSNTAINTNGTQAGTVISTGPVQGPTTYTVEALVKTTSTAGGKIIGFGNAADGDSGNYDRHVYMTNDGRLVFGAWTGVANTITSTASYNDGNWHHLAATGGPAGMTLYVDGVAVGTNPNTGAQDYWGFWRVGGDNLNGWPDQPSGGYLDASIDEAAVYSTQLTATQVQSHWTKTGLGAAPANQPPAASFTSSCAALGCSFDGSASSDPDGTVDGYRWSFGDGSTGSGVQPSHTFPAAGDYTVTLTVTDDAGATASLSQVVSPRPPANPPATFASDAFGRSVSGGFGTADSGGAWTVSSTTANYSVANGSGQITLPSAAASRWAYLTGVSRSDADVQVAFSTDKTPTGGGIYLSAVGRRVTANTEYRARARLLSTGSVALALTQLAGSSTETLISSEVTVPGLTATAGAQLRIRVVATGTAPTTLRAKAWAVGSAEPAGWQVSATSSTAGLQAPGGVGVAAYLSGSATNAPVTVSVDDLAATSTNTPPTAAFTVSCTGLDCSVDGSGSADAEGTISYLWSFADGTTATGLSPSHTYAAAGTYRITLTVTDAGGLTDVTTRTVTVP
ncbi:MAG TPA: LamG-like jellyroll fold domain-containing protein [Mycobacteriales bacterium]|nr:LamG-like jellyroll fold domain-containing protein [Mycobacteriales bacterium]